MAKKPKTPLSIEALKLDDAKRGNIRNAEYQLVMQMASLAERQGLRGKVQCIYFDAPEGIKFSSNFQWSTFCREGIHFVLREKLALDRDSEFRYLRDVQ